MGRWPSVAQGWHSEGQSLSFLYDKWSECRVLSEAQLRRCSGRVSQEWPEACPEACPEEELTRAKLNSLLK